MSREFPDRIDPWKAADGRRRFQGTMPLKRLERLAPLLAPPLQAPVDWPDARFTAGFGRDRQGLVVVDLRVEAQLPLICQRSLEPYSERVVRHSRLAVIERAEESGSVPEHYEPVLAEDGRLTLQDLVEDELLLGLPEVPRNPAIERVQRSTDPRQPPAVAEGEPPAGRGDEPTHRPFGDLAERLKSGRD